MRNRTHKPKGPLKSLGELCHEAGLTCPLDEDARLAVMVELGGPEGVTQNFPSRTFTLGTTDPKTAVEMLAYEAHTWQAWEVMRHQRRLRAGKLLT